jgi:hypothetical protein
MPTMEGFWKEIEEVTEYANNIRPTYDRLEKIVQQIKQSVQLENAGYDPWFSPYEPDCRRDITVDIDFMWKWNGRPVVITVWYAPDEQWMHDNILGPIHRAFGYTWEREAWNASRKIVFTAIDIKPKVMVQSLYNGGCHWVKKMVETEELVCDE